MCIRDSYTVGRPRAVQGRGSRVFQDRDVLDVVWVQVCDARRVGYSVYDVQRIATRRNGAKPANTNGGRRTRLPAAGGGRNPSRGTGNGTGNGRDGAHFERFGIYCTGRTRKGGFFGATEGGHDDLFQISDIGAQRDVDRTLATHRQIFAHKTYKTKRQLRVRRCRQAVGTLGVGGSTPVGTLYYYAYPCLLYTSRCV